MSKYPNDVVRAGGPVPASTSATIPDNALCVPNGKPIAIPENMRDDMARVAALVKERFDREYKAERGHGDGRVYLVPVEPMG